MQNAITKLADVDTALRRWETRLRRATNMVTKLSRKRRALAVKLGQTPVRDGTVGAALLDDKLDRALRKPDADLAIPAFLDRKDPLIAESMTAARKAAEAEARKAMPLTGRAALDAIRGTRKKAKANA
jgi:hypothetical protein